MQNKYIKLTQKDGDLEYHINSSMICGITKYNDFSIVNTMGGQVYSVTETPEQITELIKRAENFMFITK